MDGVGGLRPSHGKCLRGLWRQLPSYHLLRHMYAAYILKTMEDESSAIIAENESQVHLYPSFTKEQEKHQVVKMYVTFRKALLT